MIIAPTNEKPQYHFEPQKSSIWQRPPRPPSLLGGKTAIGAFSGKLPALVARPSFATIAWFGLYFQALSMPESAAVATSHRVAAVFRSDRHRRHYGGALSCSSLPKAFRKSTPRKAMMRGVEWRARVLSSTAVPMFPDERTSAAMRLRSAGRFSRGRLGIALARPPRFRGRCRPGYLARLPTCAGHRAIFHRRAGVSRACPPVLARERPHPAVIACLPAAQSGRLPASHWLARFNAQTSERPAFADPKQPLPSFSQSLRLITYYRQDIATDATPDELATHFMPAGAPVSLPLRR